MKTTMILLFLVIATLGYSQTEANDFKSLSDLAMENSKKIENESQLPQSNESVRDNQNTMETMNEFDPNFAHTVYFWLKNPDSESDRAAFEKSLGRFLDNSAYAKTKFIGKPPKASRDVVDGSFTYSLIVTFESAEAQAEYQVEPPHKRFVEESEELWDKVIVYDSQSIEE